MIALFLLAVVCIVAFGIIAGVMIYDLREIKDRRLLQLHPYTRRYRKRPFVSVIIYSKDINSFLESRKRVVVGSYKKLEVLSSDHATEARGEVIIEMGSDCAVDKHTIRRVVERFNINPNVDVILPYHRSVPIYSTFGVLRTYRDFLGNILHKSRSVYGVQPVGLNRVYRKDRPPYSQWVNIPFGLGSLCFALFIPFILTYFGYVAVALHQPTMLILAWALLAGFLLFGIWWDEKLGFWQKFVYSLLMPIAYPYLYVLAFIRVPLVAMRLLRQTRVLKYAA